MVGRGLLRALRGGYLGLAPASLAFAYGPAGKPPLRVPPCGSANLRFNVAHSGDAALVAFCVGRRVGVDLEAVRAIPDLEAVSRLVFSTRERGELEAALDGSAAGALRWTVLNVPVDPGCVAAVAVEGVRPRTVRRC